MKLFYFPDYTSNNPYQFNLYSDFDLSEIIPGTIDDAISAAELNNSDNVVFHLHWQNVITAPAISNTQFIKLYRNFIEKIKLFQSHGGKFVWTIHNALPHDVLFKDEEIEFHQALGELAESIYLHNESAIEQIRKNYYIASEKVKIIEHGHYIDDYPNSITAKSARKLLTLDNEVFTFGFIGQLRPYKGLDEIFDCAKHLPEFNFLIAGKPVWPYKKGNLTLRANLYDNVLCHEGFIPDVELQNFLNSADVIILPYRDILTSGSLLLAASFGKPIVIPDIPSFSIYKNLDFVFFYDPKTKGSLVNLLQKLVNELNDKTLHELHISAMKFAKSQSWLRSSKKLKNDIEAVFSNELSDGKKANDPTDRIAVLIVNYFNHEQIKTLTSSMSRYCSSQDYDVFLLDNSVSNNEYKKLKSLGLKFLYQSETNSGYAAGNNILIKKAADLGYRKFAIFNPDLILNSDIIKYFNNVLEQEPESIHSPVILTEDKKISFLSTTIESDSRSFDVKHNFVGEKIERYNENKILDTDSLNGCCMFFHASIIESNGYIPEDYFLYFEETEWTHLFKKRGGKLSVHLSQKIIHTKNTQSGGLPSVSYVYYLLRSSILFSTKLGVSAEFVKEKYLRSFVRPWLAQISLRAPDYLPLFKKLVVLAFEDGRKGVTGKVDIFSKLEKNIKDSNDGFLEVVSNGDISGWVGSKNYEKNNKLIFLINDKYKGSTFASITREDVNSAGYLGKTGFFLRTGNLALDPNDVIVLDSESFRRLPSLVKSDLGNPIYTPTYIPVENRVLGKIDGIKSGYLQGWMVDKDLPSSSVVFFLYIDKKFYGKFKTDIYREDVQRVFKGSNLNGFKIPLDTKLFSSNTKNDPRIFEIYTLNGRELVDAKVQHTNIDEDSLSLSKMSLSNYINWSNKNTISPSCAINQFSPIYIELERNKRKILSENEKSEKVKFTVVIPTFNRYELIFKAINSVLKQTYQNFEIIIIDDGSSLESIEVLDYHLSEIGDERIILKKLESNEGVSTARNVGLENATGDIITYLDSDNVWYPEYLEILSIYYKNQSVNCAYSGQEIWFSDRDNNLEFMTNIRIREFSRTQLESYNFIDLNVFSHRKSLYEELGGFSSDLRRLVDWDLILRYTNTQPPTFVPFLLNKYYFGLADNQITKTESYIDNLTLMLEKH